MRSAIQTRLGAGAVKSRSSKSAARLPLVPGIVVRGVLPRRTPCIPSSRMSRSTVQYATCRLRRRSRAVILRRPYRLSGVCRPSELVRASSSASVMTASVTVRAATDRPGAFQAR